MKKIILLISFFLCFMSCKNGVDEDVQEPYTEIEFYSVEEIQKYIQENSQFLNYNWDYNTSKFTFQLTKDLKIDMTPYDAEIINGYIKMPYVLKYDNQRYPSFLLYRIDEDDAGVLLSFDDYYNPNWDNALKYFLDYNKKATFFCFGSTTRSGLINFYFKANAAGMEVGYHTKEHKSMRDASVDVVKAGLIDPLDDFAKLGVYFNCMSYCGGGEPCLEAQELLKSRYKIIRSCADGVNRGNSLIYYSISELKSGITIYGHSFDQHYYTTDEQFEKMMTMRLCMAKMLKKVYPGFSHYFYVDGDTQKTDTRYTVNVKNLVYTFELIDKLKMKSYLYKDFY